MDGSAPAEAGGRRAGKGAGISYVLQTGLQFLIKDFLRFWMVDICREVHGETQGAGTDGSGRGLGLGTRRGEGACTRLAWAESEAGTVEGRRRAAPGGVRPSSSWLPELLWRGLGLGTRRGEGAPHPGECARQAPGCLSRSGREGTERRRSRFPESVEHPRAGTRAAQGTLHIEQPGT